MTEDRLQQLTGTVSRLESTVCALEERVAVLEGRPATPAVPEESEVFHQHGAPAEAPISEGFKRPSATRVFSLLGRSILILAGAFLLRALTDTGTLPPLFGFGLGLAYALLWIAIADRVGGKGDASGASGFGLTAVVVAFPFLFETTAVLALVSPMTGGTLLAFIAGLGLFSAWRRRSRLLAWAYTMAALGTILALGWATNAPEFFAALLLLLGTATMLLAYSRGWHLKRWAVALMADIIIFRLIILVTNPAGSGREAATLSAQAVGSLALALLTIYIGIFTYRALVQGRGVKIFDVVQSLIALLVGFGGTVNVARQMGGPSDLLGWAAVAAAGAYYTIAFTVVRQRHGRGRGFFYFATLALLFLLLGSREVAAGGWLAWSWIVLGLVFAVLGGYLNRITLRVHSAIYLVLAGIQTGMFLSVKDAFIGSEQGGWYALSLSGLVALLVTALVYGVLVRTSQTSERKPTLRLPRLMVGVVCLVGFSGLAITGLMKSLGSVAPESPAAVLAVVRTGVMAAAALGLAAVGRRQQLLELGWLVYPILGLGLAKLLIEDLRIGNPLALSISFAMFGTALILAPRMLRKGTGETDNLPSSD